MATTAIDAYGMPRSGSSAPGASSPSSRAALGAGAVIRTASAVSSSGAAAVPTESSKPVVIRRRACAGVRSRTTAPDADTSASGSEPIPSATVANTGPSASPRLRSPAFREAAAAASTDPAVGSCPASAGIVAARDSSSARPA
jgi:hypothetical protein